MTINVERDDSILHSVYEIGDGVLARRHLLALFWTGKTKRAMQKVMSRLYQRGYVDRKTVHYPRIRTPRSEPVYWLRCKGILRVAEQLGLEEPYQPANEGENQMRELFKALRADGIRWLRTPPSTAKLEHDFFVVDFKLMLLKAAAELQGVTVHWINESAFRSPRMDRVEFTIKDEHGGRIKKEQGVCPDGAFLLRDNVRKQKGLPHELRLLVEVDMGTHPVKSRWAERKAAPYAAYIGSAAYKARFGAEGGNWLIIANVSGRMDSLINQVKATAGDKAGLFMFTHWNQLGRGNVLTTPIWRTAGPGGSVPLMG